ncbi:hypothetical protein ACFY1P_20770 [Streptomyces sp. NPDC001407]|uniref:hypothetical protein n=1 Tax=Streptomyces sp. NPDC001407 TaxID=3364573 RepID=UPI0036B2A9CA
MTTSTSAAAAEALYRALLTEASAWSSDDPEDLAVLEALDAAKAPRDKLAVLQISSLLPSQLCAAVIDTLAVLDPDAYADIPPDAAPQSAASERDFAFLALATVMLHSNGSTGSAAYQRVRQIAGTGTTPAAPSMDAVRVSTLRIEPDSIRLTFGGNPFTSATVAAPAALLSPEVRTSLDKVVAHFWEPQEQNFAEQDPDDRGSHIFHDLRRLRFYLDRATA